MGMDERRSQTPFSDGLVLCPRKAHSHIVAQTCLEFYDEKKCGEFNCMNNIYAERALKERNSSNGRKPPRRRR